MTRAHSWRASCVLLSTALFASVAPCSVLAQVARSSTANAAGAETARLMQQLQQATADKSQLQAEVTRLKAELETAKKGGSGSPATETALRQKMQAMEANAGRLRASNEVSVQQLVTAQAKLDELVAKYRETATSLRDVESARNVLQDAIRTQARDLASCVENNAGLVTLNEDLLQHLERDGFWRSVAVAEPFTRIGRTRLENLAAENRARAAALKSASPPDPSPAGTPGG